MDIFTHITKLIFNSKQSFEELTPFRLDSLKQDSLDNYGTKYYNEFINKYINSYDSVVFASFIVDLNGKVQNPRILKIICNSCTKETIDKIETIAIEAISQDHGWRPSKYERKYYIPMIINFNK